jgi:hypothetical protein
VTYTQHETIYINVDGHSVARQPVHTESRNSGTYHVTVFCVVRAEAK